MQSTAAMLHIDEKTGTIQTGKQADLLILDGDPSKYIANAEKMDMIFHHGRHITQGQRRSLNIHLGEFLR